MHYVFFRYSIDDAKIGLELNIRGFNESPEWTGISFIILDTVLGEYDTEMNLNRIDNKLLNEEEINDLIPIRDLPKIIEEHKLKKGVH